MSWWPFTGDRTRPSPRLPPDPNSKHRIGTYEKDGALVTEQRGQARTILFRKAIRAPDGVSAEEVLAAIERHLAEPDTWDGPGPYWADWVLCPGVIEVPASGAGRTFTRAEVHAAISAAGKAATEFIPRGPSDEANAADDSIVGLVLSLTLGLLEDPATDPAEVIADQYAGIDPETDEFEVWNDHQTDIGDHCPWSGQPVAPNREALASGLADDDERCPQACKASAWTDPEPGTPSHRAAIVATVQGRVS